MLLNGLRSRHVLLVRLIRLMLLLLSILRLHLVRHAVPPAMMIVKLLSNVIAFNDSKFLLLVLLALLLLLLMLMLLHLNEFFFIVATHLEPQDLLVVNLVSRSFEEASVWSISAAPIAIGTIRSGIGQRHVVLDRAQLLFLVDPTTDLPQDV